jgi:hypothetical protein
LNPLSIVPFPYRTGKYDRKHGPDGYTDYGSFKPWLRDEYTFRCVYCLFREAWFSYGFYSFHIEHFVAKTLGGARVAYENLFYACEKCNLVKARKTGLLNPDQVGYGDHILQNDDGRVEAKTPQGSAIIDLLQLNAKQRVDERAKFLKYARIASALDSPEHQGTREFLLYMLAKEFGYPEDLPDLSKERAPKNTKKAGVETSHFARRAKGELASMY